MAALARVYIIVHGSREDTCSYIIAGSTMETADKAYYHCREYPNTKYINEHDEEIPAPGHGELEPPQGVWYTLDRDVVEDFGGDASGADRVWLRAKVMNVGDALAESASITFSVIDSTGAEVVIDTLELPAIKPGKSTAKVFNWKFSISGCVPGEANLTNNVYIQPLSVYYADYGSGRGLYHGYHPGRDGYKFENWDTSEEVAEDLVAALTPHFLLQTMLSGVATGPYLRSLILLAATGGKVIASACRPAA